MSFAPVQTLFAYVNEGNTLRTLSEFQHGTDVMFAYTVYSLSLNNLLLTCRGNSLATVLRPCTDLQASSKFQILHVRRTENVDYRAVCRTSYSYLVPAMFITVSIAIIDYNITWNTYETKMFKDCAESRSLLKEKTNKYIAP